MKTLARLLFFALSINILFSPLGNHAQALSFTSPCSSSLLAGKIYVDSTAGPFGNGSKALPYKTLRRAATRYNSDSSVNTICLSGSFLPTNRVEFTGAGQNKLTIKPTNGTPVIDLSNLSSLTPLRFDFSLSTKPDISLRGLEILGETEFFQVNDVTLTNMHIDASGDDYGVELEDIDDLSINNSSFTDSSISSVLVNEFDHISVENSQFNDSGDHAIELLTGYIIASTLTVENSQFSNYLDSAIHHQSGASSDGLHTITIDRSSFDGNNTAQSALHLEEETIDRDISDSFFMNHNGNAIDIPAYSSINYTWIYRNSFYNNDVSYLWESQTGMYENIFSMGSGQAAFNLDSSLSNPFYSSRMNDNNLFYSFATSTPIVDAYMNYTLSDWQNAYSVDTNSFTADPLFTSATDLHIQAGSPAIDAGEAIGTVYHEDIDGDQRTGNIDLGADEF